MKIVLTTLNAKYIHTSLAIHNLYGYAHSRCKADILPLEFNINQPINYITSELYRAAPDAIAFACYIWNISHTLRIADRLKKLLPDVTIILGGPEVSFDYQNVLTQHAYIDYIVIGEGEQSFTALINALDDSATPHALAGIAYRTAEGIACVDAPPLLRILDDIPFPYALQREDLEHKILYYETSRGCPFRCQYCLSSTVQGVRYLSQDRLENDLLLFLQAKVRQVKFVDRTFNCNPQRALAILRFIAAHDNYYTNFHLEIAADLLDKPTLDFLSTVRPGLFQFEIGIQSTYEPTLNAIERTSNLAKLFDNVKAVKRLRTVHVHLDLIAGLPYETYDRFAISFNHVFLLEPDQLQLGFLKMLKGSGIRRDAEKHGYRYTSEAPYEVLFNQYISFTAMLKLKAIEDLVETYFNSYLYRTTTWHLATNLANSPFAFWEDFARYWQDQGYHHTPHSSKKLGEILAHYLTLHYPDTTFALQLLKFDLLQNDRSVQLPSWLPNDRTADYQQQFYRFLTDPHNIEKYLPEMAGKSARDISRQVQIEFFAYDVPHFLQIGEYLKQHTAVLFHYGQRDVITGLAKYSTISLLENKN